MSALMPGRGFVAEPGFVGVAPGKGEIMMPPVSVCHHVSTIGQRPPPIVSRYHIHASGFIGSPTCPSRRHGVRASLRAHCAPPLMKTRNPLGAVLTLFTGWRSIICQK